jgi:hypothetical protein
VNERVGEARIGQWYQRGDKGEIFVVTGRDASSGTIEIQSFDGDIHEIGSNDWSALPLEFAETPEDWTGPLDLDPEDVRYSETAMTVADWNEPLQPAQERAETWEENTPEDERDPLGEGQSTEESLSDNPEAAAQVP